MTDRECYFFLQSVPGVGNLSIERLLREFKEPKSIYCANEKELTGVLKAGQLKCFLDMRENFLPDRELKKLQSKGIYYISVADVDYPESLRHIPKPPYGLFYMGKLPDADRKSVAVIGARDNTGYGANMTRAYCRIMAEAGIQIISGMAKGIDGIAHSAALDAGGDTFAVLGCGVDICYPEQNRGIYDKMMNQGGIISEYPPGTPPSPGLFPLRNRIISGLSSVVLVIEARYKSGTLITVDAALEQGKEVMALPGRVNDSLSQGCNMLIGQGAVMLKEPEVFREELFNLMGISKGKEDEGEVFSEKEKLLLQVLEDTPLSLNEIWERVQNCNEDEKGVKIEGVTELTTILMELCVRKKIVVWQGNYRKTL